MPQLSDDPKHRAGEEKCIADIATHDLHVLRVHGDNDWPEFTYSVGLHERFGIPEVIILGLRGELAHSLLNELAARAREGERIAAGDTLSGLLEGFDVVLLPVPEHHIEPHFGWALWYYDGRPFPAVQLVYPTTSGIWPWDPEASEHFKANQPLLESVPVPEWARRPS